MYEREGLVIPSRRESGHRAYTEDQLERIRCYRQTMARDKITIAHLKRLLSLIPCWEINNCPESSKATCKAYPSREAPCWAVTNKSWQELCGKCLECEVYKKSEDVGDAGTDDRGAYAGGEPGRVERDKRKRTTETRRTPRATEKTKRNIWKKQGQKLPFDSTSRSSFCFASPIPKIFLENPECL